MRHVKFTPEEMAYDIPAELDPARWVPAGRGAAALRGGRPPEGPIVRLALDVASVFKDEAAVNNALRKLIEAVPAKAKRRKTA